MQGSMRTNYRRELDERMLPFRLVRKGKGKAGWLRGIRQAVGIPVEDLAQRMGVKRWEIRLLELAEEGSRIQLGTLRRAAEGLGCELVYGLVPKEGTLEEMAAEQAQAREKAKAQKQQEAKEPFLKYIGWRESFLGALRTILRREGYRVRPSKTDRGVAQEMADFEMNLRVLKLAGMLGPFMKEFMEGENQRSGNGE
jgi:predicted DNA-binding mobile mystery protein A